MYAKFPLPSRSLKWKVSQPSLFSRLARNYRIKCGEEIVKIPFPPYKDSKRNAFSTACYEILRFYKYSL